MHEEVLEGGTVVSTTGKAVTEDVVDAVHPEWMKEMLHSVENEQVIKWIEATGVDLRFNEENASTKRHLKELDRILRESMLHAPVIGANSEAVVYKIGRYMLEKGVCKMSDITILNGMVVDAYFSSGEQDWQQIDRLNRFFRDFSERSIMKKWVFIPHMLATPRVPVGIRWIRGFTDECKAAGLVFFSGSPMGITESLCSVTGNTYVKQFPLVQYRYCRPNVKNDEW